MKKAETQYWRGFQRVFKGLGTPSFSDPESAVLILSSALMSREIFSSAFNWGWHGRRTFRHFLQVCFACAASWIHERRELRAEV